MRPTAADLERISLFASLSDSEREELAESFEVRSKVAGTELIGERTGGYSFFALADGEARVSVNGIELAALKSRRLFWRDGTPWRWATNRQRYDDHSDDRLRHVRHGVPPPPANPSGGGGADPSDDA